MACFPAAQKGFEELWRKRGRMLTATL